MSVLIVKQVGWCIMCLWYQVTPGGKAQTSGLVAGDIILSINNIATLSMKHHEAQRLIVATKVTLELVW